MSLSGKKVVLGVTGSIAAYKACEIIHFLKDEGAIVRVIMTPSADKLISSLTFQALTGSPVVINPFGSDTGHGMPHIYLAEWADLYIIAPCTANTISELAQGLTSTLVSLLYLSFDGPVFIAPAMNSNMLNSPAICNNIAILEKRGVFVLPSGWGKMACGTLGYGKLLDAESLVAYVLSALAFSGKLPSLKGNRCLVILGHTEEPWDAVRFLSNRSSGKMGFALARALRLCGAEVSLLYGKTQLAPSNEWHEKSLCQQLLTTADIHRETLKAAEKYKAVFLVAALADFIPTTRHKDKIKGSSSIKMLELKPAVNTLKTLVSKRKPGQILVGFALENRGSESAGLKKIKEGGVDMLIVNSVYHGQKCAGIGEDNIRAGIVLQSDLGKKLPALKTMSKPALAASICRNLYGLLKNK